MSISEENIIPEHRQKIRSSKRAEHNFQINANEVAYQNGAPGSFVKTSAITMKASPVPCAACNLKH